MYANVMTYYTWVHISLIPCEIPLFTCTHHSISSLLIEKNIGPNPQTTRGAATHVYAHPKEPRIIYPSGNFIVVKNMEVSCKEREIVDLWKLMTWALP